MDFEFLIPKRPVSLQTDKRDSLKNWKKYVQTEAMKTWQAEFTRDLGLSLTLVYFYNKDPLDIDNIIKPIQDALVGLVYEDDGLITDISAHRRHVSALYRNDDNYPAKYSALLVRAILSQNECVYVRVRDSALLENYL
jgi:crossover junction endodeoxyribonuclease RusA